jgi:diaminopimelate epimerase
VPLLSKHHALGNDFLVLFDDQPLPRLAWEAVAVRLCHRHRGLGADGLIVALTNPPEGHDVAMALFNADGSRAEMSGNGIRCLVHAYARRHHLTEGEVVVHTDAGTRPVTFGPGASGREIVARVGMGPATAIDEPEHWADLGCDPLRPVAHLSLGNPHAVVGVDDVRAVDLAALGARVPTVNLEIVAAGPEPFGVTMRVHERGAGILIERSIREKIVLVGVTLPPDTDDDTEAGLDELALWSTPPGPTRWPGRAAPCRPDPPTFIGKGKAEELRELAWPPTATRWCSTTSSPPPSSSTSRSCSGAPPSTAPR